MALDGRTPNRLPSLPLSAVAADDSTGTRVGPTRHVHRVRELALQSMIEGIARSRIKRALDARTPAPGEASELSVGDLVDFYRPPASKDAPGWRGPATVTDVLNISHGT
eukprot:1244303-Lingulodinium_polyedra.AAC.1